MKKWLLVFAIIGGLSASLSIVIKQRDEMSDKWKVAMANVKAYDEMLGEVQKKDAAHQLAIRELKTYQDSILRQLDATRRELKVKDKDLKSVHYVASTFVRTDTIMLNDTIFRNQEVQVDTTISDEWYNLQLGLYYPSTVFVKPSFKSQKHIVVSTKKETVSPPKKFFLLRWFQKKHRVLRVDVVEKNPYVTDESSRYVEIIR